MNRAGAAPPAGDAAAIQLNARSRRSYFSSRRSMSSKLRPCECPGLLKSLGAGRDLTNRATAGVIVPIEINARPAIGEADFVAAALGHSFMLTDADGGGHGAIKAASQRARKLSIASRSRLARATAYCGCEN